MCIITNDTHIKRFLAPQERDYAKALKEISNGLKEGHWIWYIFPQIKGLGTSKMSEFYGIGSLTEAYEYLEHPILGKRLVEITTALYNVENKTIDEIVGHDAIKVRSCMTLFGLITDEDSIFNKVIEKYFDGELDIETFDQISDWLSWLE